MNYKTMYYKPISLTKASLLIFDKAKQAKVYQLSGDCTLGKEYPYSECDIRIESEIVGRRHGEFFYDESEGAYYYIDNNSTNGTYINGVKLEPYNERGSKAFQLSDGDIIRVDNKKLNKPHPEAVLIIFSTTLKGSEKWQELMLSGRSEVVIGRDRNCTITLNSMMTSRRHAVLKYDGSQWTIKDKKSTNGTGLNVKELRKETTIFDHDVIRIADSILVFLGDRIIYNIIEQPEISLQVNIRKKQLLSGEKF